MVCHFFDKLKALIHDMIQNGSFLLLHIIWYDTLKNWRRLKQLTNPLNPLEHSKYLYNKNSRKGQQAGLLLVLVDFPKLMGMKGQLISNSRRHFPNSYIIWSENTIFMSVKQREGKFPEIHYLKIWRVDIIFISDTPKCQIPRDLY